MVIICLTCLSPWLLALQGQRTWQMEVLNVGWMNQYMNEWMNDGRVSYLLISSSLSEPLSITMETPQNLVLGWSPQFSIVKGLPCAMIYSEALAANHKQYVLTAFFTRDEWVHFPWGKASRLITATACSESWPHLHCDLEDADPELHIPRTPWAVGSWMREVSLGEERVGFSSWAQRSLKFITNIVPNT